MSKRIVQLAFLIAAASLALTPLYLGAESMYSGGAPDGRTGAPGENLCTQCHSNFPVNSGDGNIQILGLPDTAQVGDTFAITIELQDVGQQRWGFELTAITPEGNGIDAFIITDETNTQLADYDDPARDYVTHTSIGTYAGTADGPVQWAVNGEYETDILEPIYHYYYVAGNAADNNGSTSGDYIYTAVDSVLVLPGPRVPASSPIGLIVLTALIIITAIYILSRHWLTSS